MSPTIKDVAKHAGVAVSTVSLVVNNKANVANSTRKKIQHAIEDLKYHPRRSARGLVMRKSGNIGFILTDDHFSVAEPFYTKIFLGTEFEARKYDYYILLTTLERRNTKNSVPRFLLERNVDGVIFAGSVPTKIIDYVKNTSLPFIFVDYLPNNGRYSSILIDNINGAFQATDHLIKSGHKRIVFIGGGMDHPSLKHRYEGYKNALAAAQIPISEELVYCNEAYPGILEGYKTAQNLIKDGSEFTALFAANDALALGAVRCFREHRLRIPEDVAIIGFDDVAIANTAHPTLTTMHVPKEEMGAIALRRIVEMIDKKDISVSKTVVPVKLVLRESH